MAKPTVLAVLMVMLVKGSLSFMIDKTGCGTAKSCYSEPAGCSSSADCDYLLVYIPQANGDVMFELSSKQNWHAVGFSADNKMPNTDVLLCLRKNDGSVDVGHYWTDSYSAPAKSTQGTAALTVLKAEYISGVLSCRISRPKNPGIQNMRDLNSKWFLLYARGNVANDAIQQHSVRTTSPGSVNVTAVTALKAAKSKIPYIETHGVLMVIAWIGFASVGMFMARYMRKTWSKKVFSKDIWFQVHRTLMVATVSVTILGIIYAFYFKEWRWSANAGAHPILGIIVLCLAVFQPIIAVFRPHPGESRRWLFNWVHRSIGVTTYILAVATVFLGVMLPNLAVQKVAPYLLIAYCVFVVVEVVSFDIYSFLTNKKGKTQAIAMQNVSGTNPNGHVNDTPAPSMSHKEKWCRRLAFAFTVLVVGGLTIALIVVIETQGNM